MPANPLTWGITTVTEELVLSSPTTIKLTPAAYDVAGTYTLFNYTGTPLNLQGFPDEAALIADRLIVDSSTTAFNVSAVTVDTVNKRIRVTLVPR